MRHLRSRALIVAVAAMVSSGCFGSFQAVRTVYSWNKSFGDGNKWAQELMYIVIGGIVPVYGVAGFLDAVVGGGGLILVPALFATYLSASPATLLGTNKSASVWGTLFALWQYSKRIELPWRKLWIAVIVTWVGSWLDRKSTRLNSSHVALSRMPSSA